MIGTMSGFGQQRRDSLHAVVRSTDVMEDIRRREIQPWGKASVQRNAQIHCRMKGLRLSWTSGGRSRLPGEGGVKSHQSSTGDALATHGH